MLGDPFRLGTHVHFPALKGHKHFAKEDHLFHMHFNIVGKEMLVTRFVGAPCPLPNIEGARAQAFCEGGSPVPQALQNWRGAVHNPVFENI